MLVNTSTKSTSTKKYGLLYWLRTQLWFCLFAFSDLTTNVLKNLGLYKRKRAKFSTSLTDKTVVITGGNAGIGKEVVKTVLRLGACVIIACRDQTKTKKVVEEILDFSGHDKKNNLILVKLDLSSLASVRACAAEINSKTTKIDILINNAGIMGVPSNWKSVEGFELQFATNYLGHYLLTHLLMGKLKASESSRIVNVSSIAIMAGWLDFENSNFYQRSDHLNKKLLGVYGRSKLASHLFAVELARRARKNGDKLTVYSAHPGVVRTDITRYLNWFSRLLATLFQSPITLSPEEGAQTVLHCALSEEVEGESGFFYQNCTRVDKLPAHTIDKEDAVRIWELSAKLVGIVDKK